MAAIDSSNVPVKTSAKLAMLATVITFLTGMQGRTTNFENRVLISHNKDRLMLGLPPLKWDARLAQRAKNWADHLAVNVKFEHSPNVPGQPLEGENIWGGTRGAFFPEDMVALWIAEKAYFVEGVFPANCPATSWRGRLCHEQKRTGRNHGMPLQRTQKSPTDRPDCIKE